MAIKAREKYTLMLSEFVRHNYPNCDVLQRMRKCLWIIRMIEVNHHKNLLFLQEYSMFSRQRHALLVLHNYANMKGKLTIELHVKGTIYENEKDESLRE